MLKRFRRRRVPRSAPTEWQRRPVLSAAIRLLVMIGPAAVSLVIALVLSRVLPRADSALSAALWLCVITAGSLGSLILLERAARRLLPLAALLNVSLLFPDKAPARFALVRKTGSPSDLRAKLEAARESGDGSAAAMETVVQLVLALSVHDKGTRGHSERVRVFTDLIADELKIDAASRARLRWAALLHDIGKLEVATSLLTKSGKPDEAEWEVLHRHPEEGARIAASLMGWLGEWGAAVAEHHERYDGTGYPRGLKGAEISLAARIVSVADTYEVMTAPRPYKRPMSVSAARKELVAVSGTQLDPDIVRAFLNVSVGRLWRTVGFGSWIAQLPILPRLFASFGQLGSVAASGATTVAGAAVVTVGALTPGGPFVHTAPGSGASPSPAVVAPVGSASVAPTAAGGGSSGGATTPDATATVHASPSARTTRSGSATQAPTSAPTSQPTTGASATPVPTATLDPTPEPTPKPTPTPQPGPWTCSNCQANAPPSCTSYCKSNDDLPNCTTYCQGRSAVQCTSHCFTAKSTTACLRYCRSTVSNDECLRHCASPDNPACVFDCHTGQPQATAAVQPTAAAPLSVAAVLPAFIALRGRSRRLRRPVAVAAEEAAPSALRHEGDRPAATTRLD